MRGKKEEEKPDYQRCFTAINRWQMHNEGYTYQLQGYDLGDGTIPFWLEHDHMFIRNVYNEVLAIKKKEKK